MPVTVVHATTRATAGQPPSADSDLIHTLADTALRSSLLDRLCPRSTGPAGLLIRRHPKRHPRHALARPRLVRVPEAHFGRDEVPDALLEHLELGEAALGLELVSFPTLSPYIPGL